MYVGILFGFGEGNFSTQSMYSTGLNSAPMYIIVGYFNDDDQTDIAVICIGNKAVAVLFGTGNGKVFYRKKYPTNTTSSYLIMAYEDFNNDSRLNLVVASTLNDIIDIYYGNGNEPFAIPIYGPTGLKSKPHFVAVGDFNHDNRPDIVIANDGTDNIGIVLASKTEQFSDLMPYSTGTGSRLYAIVVGDFNNDKHLDIAVINSGTNGFIIFQGYGNGSFVAIGSHSTGTDSIPHSIGVNDFNNDKRLDIAIANSDANNALILFGFGNESSYSMDYDSRPYPPIIDFSIICISSFASHFVVE